MGYPDLSISVIIPVRNGRAYFRRCLSAIVGANAPTRRNHRGGRWRHGWLLANRRGTGRQSLEASQAGGPARARNLGAAAAQGDILLFIDADVAIPPGILGEIEKIFRDEPGLAAVFGSYDSEPYETNFLSQYKNLFHHYVHQLGREEASTFWGACGAIRRNVFEEVGRFDERYCQPSIEDIDLGYRLKKGAIPFGSVRICR